jgi:hypothetical protein
LIRMAKSTCLHRPLMEEARARLRSQQDFP